MRVRLLLATGLTVVLAFFMFQTLTWADDPDEIHILATDQQIAVSQALTWLRTQQDTDGSFGGAAGLTLDAVQALVAANEDPNQWTRNGNSPIHYLQTQAGTYTTGPASTGKMALGVLASNHDPRDFAGLDLIAQLHGYYNPATGQFSTTLSATNVDQAYAMMALAASFQPVTDTARTRLISRQTASGGWCYDNDSAWGCWPDNSTTAQAVQALLATGEPVDSPAILSATQYLSTTQQSDGSWGDGTPRAYDTAPAIQQLVTAGQNPDSPAWTRGGTSGFAALQALQNASGAFPGWYGTDDLMTTAQSIPALMGRPFPLRGRAAAARAGLNYLATQQNADGGWGYYGVAPSSAGLTCDVVFAIVAAGQAPATYVSSGEATPIAYLKAQAASYATSAGATGKLIAAVAAVKESVLDFGGIDLRAKLASFYDSGTGMYGYGSVSDQAWAIIALGAMREPIPAAAVTYLQNLRQADYSWSYYGDAAYGTGLALMALRAAGQNPNDFWFSEGLVYFQNTLQTTDGGLPSSPSGTSDVNSSALGTLGVIAGNSTPLEWRWTKQLAGSQGISVTVNDPNWYMLARQDASGAFEAPYSQIMATAQAIPALLWQTYPIGAQVTSNTLVAGNVSVAFPSCGNMLVQAPFSQDLNGNGAASLDWVDDLGGFGSTLAMIRGGSLFTYTLVTDPSAATYTVTVTYSDTLDGVEGTNPQTVTAQLNETWPGTISAVQECNTISVTATYCGDANVNGSAVVTYTHSSQPAVTGSVFMVKDVAAHVYHVAVPVSVTASSSLWENYRIDVTYSDPDGISGADARSTTVSVDDLLEASFTVSPAWPVSGTITTFTDTSSGGTATAWQWNFGDGGALAISQNPTHTYTLSGTVTAILTTTFGTCGDFATSRPVTVTSESQAKVYLPVVVKDHSA